LAGACADAVVAWFGRVPSADGEREKGGRCMLGRQRPRTGRCFVAQASTRAGESRGTRARLAIMVDQGSGEERDGAMGLAHGSGVVLDAVLGGGAATTCCGLRARARRVRHQTAWARRALRGRTEAGHLRLR